MSTRRHAPVVAALVASLFLTALPAVGNDHARPPSASCSRSETARVIKRFVRAFNRGDVDRLDRLWAQEPDFEWYFVDEERGQGEAENRSTLRSYFQDRVDVNDRLRLRRLSIGPTGGNDPTSFNFKLLRTTDDQRDRASGLFHGKGAAQEIFVLPSLTDPIPTQRCRLIMWAMDNDTE